MDFKRTHYPGFSWIRIFSGGRTQMLPQVVDHNCMVMMHGTPGDEFVILAEFAYRL